MYNDANKCEPPAWWANGSKVVYTPLATGDAPTCSCWWTDLCSWHGAPRHEYAWVVQTFVARSLCIESFYETYSLSYLSSLQEHTTQTHDRAYLIILFSWRFASHDDMCYGYLIEDLARITICNWSPSSCVRLCDKGVAFDSKGWHARRLWVSQ